MYYQDDREPELWLRTLVEGIPQLVWRAHAIADWNWSSPQWTAFTGLTDDNSRGRGWLQAVHPDDRAIALKAWEAALVERGLDTDYRICRSDGQYRWFRTRATPVINEAGHVSEWLGTSTDVHTLRQLESEQKVLVAELQHRTRNLLALVQSISEQTIEYSCSLDDFRDKFETRLAALSRVQGLLSRSEYEPITVRKLVELELQAVGVETNDERLSLDGDGTCARNSTAQTLALAVHELCTNAYKYGALSHPRGRLSISWRGQASIGQPSFRLVWREEGIQTKIAEQRRVGFGRTLIEAALPHQLGAETCFELSDTELVCEVQMPLSKFRRGDAGE